jgi:hypothetical protein
VVEELEYPSKPESYAVGSLANEFQLHCDKAGFTPVFRIITEDYTVWLIIRLCKDSF